MLESMWIKRNPLALLVEMQMDSTTMEYSMQISLKKQTNKQKKLRINLPHDPATLVLGIYPEETIIRKHTCTLMFIGALFTIARTCNPPRMAISR